MRIINKFYSARRVLRRQMVSLSVSLSVSASHTVGRGFASRPGHTKDHLKIGTNCFPSWLG